MQKHLITALILAIVVFLQTTFIPLFSINNVNPDIILIFVVSIAILRGQIYATVSGFFAGLIWDLLTGEFFGLSAFTKTLTGFIIGYLYNENKTEVTFKSYQYVLITGTAALINNMIYFAIYTQGTPVTFFKAMFDIGLFSAIYTTIITIFPMFYFQRKRISY